MGFDVRSKVGMGGSGPVRGNGLQRRVKPLAAVFAAAILVVGVSTSALARGGKGGSESLNGAGGADSDTGVGSPGADISFAAAAAISGVRPGATARSVGPVVSMSSSHSRNWPTERCETARYAWSSRSSSTMRVTSSMLVRDDRVHAQLRERQVCEHRARRDTLDRIARRHAGEVVTALRRIRFREDLLHGVEAVAHAANRRASCTRRSYYRTS